MESCELTHPEKGIQEVYMLTGDTCLGLAQQQRHQAD